MRPQVQDQIHPDIRSIGFSWYEGVGFIFDLWHKRISWTPNTMLRRQEEAVDTMMSECWDDWQDDGLIALLDRVQSQLETDGHLKLANEVRDWSWRFVRER